VCSQWNNRANARRLPHIGVMNPEEMYDVRLSPQKAIDHLVTLTAAILANPHFDVCYEEQIHKAVSKAETALFLISHDVACTLNADPNNFHLPGVD
jgi:hypothetical protein